MIFEKGTIHLIFPTFGHYLELNFSYVRTPQLKNNEFNPTKLFSLNLIQGEGHQQYITFRNVSCPNSQSGSLNIFGVHEIIVHAIQGLSMSTASL